MPPPFCNAISAPATAASMAYGDEVAKSAFPCAAGVVEGGGGVPEQAGAHLPQGGAETRHDRRHRRILGQIGAQLHHLRGMRHRPPVGGQIEIEPPEMPPIRPRLHDAHRPVAPLGKKGGGSFRSLEPIGQQRVGMPADDHIHPGQLARQA